MKHKRDVIMQQYRNMVAVNSVKARALIKKLDYKDDCELLKCIAQTYLDECLFENDGTMREHIDERKWRMAERYIIKAFVLNSNHLHVLYTMGKVRKLGGAHDLAIYCYEKIIDLGVKSALKGEYKLSRDFAWELINDSKFELYRIYYDIKEFKTAEKYLRQYKAGLQKGIHTIYKPLSKFILTPKDSRLDLRVITGPNKATKNKK